MERPLNIDKNLANIFDLDLTPTDKPLDVVKIDAIKAETESLENQRNYVRKNLVELIEKGKTALESLSTIANSTEKSRDFEVMSTLIKTLVETNTTLLDIEVAHKKPQDKPTEGGVQQATTINNNAVFVGTTADLVRHIKTINADEVIDNTGQVK